MLPLEIFLKRCKSATMSQQLNGALLKRSYTLTLVNIHFVHEDSLIEIF